MFSISTRLGLLCLSSALPCPCIPPLSFRKWFVSGDWSTALLVRVCRHGPFFESFFCSLAPPLSFRCRSGSRADGNHRCRGRFCCISRACAAATRVRSAFFFLRGAAVDRFSYLNEIGRCFCAASPATAALRLRRLATPLPCALRLRRLATPPLRPHLDRNFTDRRRNPHRNKRATAEFISNAQGCRLPRYGKFESPSSFKKQYFWLLRACCVLYITPLLLPRSLAIRNKKRHATWFSFCLFRWRKRRRRSKRGAPPL